MKNDAETVALVARLTQEAWHGHAAIVRSLERRSLSSEEHILAERAARRAASRLKTAIEDVEIAIGAREVPILIIEDGAHCWGADERQVLAHLKDNGWAIIGEIVTEPLVRPGLTGDIEGGGAYQRLCASVQPLPGFAPSNVEPKWSRYRTLQYSPDLGDDVWYLEPKPPEETKE